MTNLESLQHVGKLPIMLLDLLQQVLAQKQFLDTSDFVALFERPLHSIQFTKEQSAGDKGIRNV
jgi:hypothetical protein